MERYRNWEGKTRGCLGRFVLRTKKGGNRDRIVRASAPRVFQTRARACGKVTVQKYGAGMIQTLSKICFHIDSLRLGE